MVQNIAYTVKAKAQANTMFQAVAAHGNFVPY
jgi:hypothetical protein